MEEIAYASYKKEFIHGKKQLKLPANPHEVWQGIYIFAIPFILIVLGVQCLNPDEITQVGAYLYVGVIVLVISFLQDLCNGVACVFDAEYPKFKIGRYMEE